jgi:hypothetical protein
LPQARELGVWGGIDGVEERWGADDEEVVLEELVEGEAEDDDVVELDELDVVVGLSEVDVPDELVLVLTLSEDD